MAFDAFSFGSETDLLPVWDEDVDIFLPPLDLPDYEYWDLGTIPMPEPPSYLAPPSIVQDYYPEEDPVKVESVSCSSQTIDYDGDPESVMAMLSLPPPEPQPTVPEPHLELEGRDNNTDSHITYIHEIPIKSESLRPRKDKRRVEETLIDYEAVDNDSIPTNITDPMCLDMEDDPTGGFKLPASKSPIMEAMVVCALNGWGIDVIKNTRGSGNGNGSAEVVFRVNDFDRYYRISRTICSKQRPTDDLGSRVKSLRRWFVNFPKKKDRCENAPFLLIVKPHIAKKVNEIIERNTRMLGLTKRRRRQ